MPWPGELSRRHKLEHRRGQMQQAQRVRNAGAGFADPPRNLLLRQSELLLQAQVALCLFYNVQVFPLQVFDQGYFHNLLRIRRPHDDRHLFQPGHARRAPAAFSPAIIRYRPPSSSDTISGETTPCSRMESASSRSFSSSNTWRGWPRLGYIRDRDFRRRTARRGLRDFRLIVLKQGVQAPPNPFFS